MNDEVAFKDDEFYISADNKFEYIEFDIQQEVGVNKYVVVVCGNINSLRDAMSKTARTLESITQDIVLDRNDCTIRYKIHLDTWHTEFLLPHQLEKIEGLFVHDFYTVGPESDAMFEMTRRLAYRYFATQHKEQSCKIKSTPDLINKSLISSLKKLASKILSWIRL